MTVNVILDLGANCLQGLNQLIDEEKVPSDSKIFCFEANPYISNNAKKYIKRFAYKHANSDLNYFNTAVSAESGLININCAKLSSDDFSRAEEWKLSFSDIIKLRLTRKLQSVKRKFFLESDFQAQSSNTLASPPTNDRDLTYVYQEKLVPAVSLYDLMSSIINDTQHFNFYIKVDIEGAEFLVLESFISSFVARKNISVVFFIEWHERFFPSQLKQYVERRKAISTSLINHGFILHDWV